MHESDIRSSAIDHCLFLAYYEFIGIRSLTPANRVTDKNKMSCENTLD